MWGSLTGSTIESSWPLGSSVARASLSAKRRSAPAGTERQLCRDDGRRLVLDAEPTAADRVKTAVATDEPPGVVLAAVERLTADQR